MVASIEDYSAAIVIPEMVKAPDLQGGHPVEKNGRLVRYAGGFCVVYPFQTKRRKYAVRCWHTPVQSVQDNLETIFSAIRKCDLPYFVPCSYVRNALLTARGLQPAVVMDWVEAQPLKRYIGDHLDRPKDLEKLAESFLRMTATLHKAGISHGDLQHGNILVQQDGSLTLVDYDSMFVPGMKDVPDEIKGLAGYQHPARCQQRFRSPVSDYFSELVIYASIRTLAGHPGLWRKYNLADTETMLFTEADISSGGASDIFRLIESDRNLRPLGRAIQDALRQTTLERIIPLEDIVHGQTENLVESLSQQWKSNGFKPRTGQSNIEIFKQLADIYSKW
jgi:serine/threonine protein kinase